MVREIPAGLSNAQVWGIALGIVAGAFAADMLGARGLVTVGLAAGGGAVGNWLFSMEHLVPSEAIRTISDKQPARSWR